MVVLGPLSPEDSPRDFLTGEDRAWLRQMCDVLPPHMPVDGTPEELIYGPPDPAILSDGVW